MKNMEYIYIYIHISINIPSEVGATTSNSDHNRVNPKGPQNNYTLKHNSLTKSSSWRGAHCLLAYGKYGWPPYYSSKPKANEVWRFEKSLCGCRAVSKTHSDKVNPSSPSPGKSLRKWNTATQTRRSLTREHHKQYRQPHPRCLLIPRIFISFAMISNNKLLQKFTRIPGLSLPISTRNFLQGHMEVDRNDKMSSGRTYNWHSICLRWSDLLMQGHIFLRHSLE